MRPSGLLRRMYNKQANKNPKQTLKLKVKGS